MAVCSRCVTSGRSSHNSLQEIYQADGWRWSPKSKHQDLADPATRFLLAWDSSCSTSSGDPITSATPQAYLAFRFEEEAGVAVLYVYELQLSQSVQRRGLGRFLMQLAELLACRLVECPLAISIDGFAISIDSSTHYTDMAWAKLCSQCSGPTLLHMRCTKHSSIRRMKRRQWKTRMTRHGWQGI